MKSLFLDANALLDFYRFGNDDISEMHKLVTLVQHDEIRIVTNSLLKAEVSRRREGEIAASFDDLKVTKFKIKAPNYCVGTEEYVSLTDALKKANSAHEALVSAVGLRIQERTLPADVLIDSIFSIATDNVVDVNVIERAQLRRALNNPPGKKDALGDAVHWECLLADAKLYSLDMVSRDEDFASELQPKNIKTFLAEEWRDQKGKHASVELFRSLSEYFRANFPQIKLSEEAQKNELIGQLQASPNFTTTHSIIGELSKFEFFTNSQVVQLFGALVNNTQVLWIAKDEDVNEFYRKLKDKSYIVPDEMQDTAAEALGVDKDDFFFPF